MHLSDYFLRIIFKKIIVIEPNDLNILKAVDSYDEITLKTDCCNLNSQH